MVNLQLNRHCNLIITSKSDEIWKDVPNNENLVEVSNYGNIRYTQSKEYIIPKFKKNNLTFSLQKNGKITLFILPRLSGNYLTYLIQIIIKLFITKMEIKKITT